MKGQIVTVFGGSGFIGRYVVQKLANNGAIIRVAVRNPDKALFLKTMGEVGQIIPVRVNITDEESVAKALNGADHVVNLVGILYERGQQKFSDIHVIGATTIAKVAAEKAVKHLVHISALGADPSSLSRYASTKGKAEQKVLEEFKSATIIRPSVVFGAEDKFFNRFACVARYSLALPLFGGGKTKFQPVYVGDVADAIVKILGDNHTKSPYAAKVFELGGPNVYTFKEIMEFILKTTQRKRALIPLPYSFATLIGVLAQFMPDPLITPDQVKLLQKDNIVNPKALSFKQLDIHPASVEVIVPTYLKRFRYHG